MVLTVALKRAGLRDDDPAAETLGLGNMYPRSVEHMVNGQVSVTQAQQLPVLVELFSDLGNLVHREYAIQGDE